VGEAVPGTSRWIVCALAVWVVGVLRHIELPGPYMDAVNPEYLVVQALHPDPSNPVWTLPGRIPLLSSLYAGMQNYWLGLPVFWLFGTSITSLRLFHGLFGAAIVALVYHVVHASTRRPWVAGVVATGLATDPALIAGLRTQFAILLGGAPWLLASVGLAMTASPPDADPRRARRRLLLSGLCFGLSVYGYFVYGFFGPALLLLVMSAGVTPRRAALAAWSRGVALGLVPYLVAYVLWWRSLGGLGKFARSVGSIVTDLQPIVRSSLLERLEYVAAMARNALSNRGSELMMFGVADIAPSTDAKLVIAISLVAAGAVVCAARRAPNRPLQAMALLASYVMVSLAFGGRLWAHHFIPLLPVLYVGVGFALDALTREADVARQAPRPRRAVLAAAIAGVLVIGILNLAHQRRLFDRLLRTGGTAKLSDAITLLASDALRDPPGSIYVFPEWGFFMPFAFLTENRVPYELTFDTPRVRRAIEQGREVVVAHWTGEEAARYRAELARLGASRFSTRAVLQRDGAAAFHLLTGAR
jgi:hypothetical protein